MGDSRRRGTIAALAIGAALLVLPSAAPAHVTETAGPYEVTIGWGKEPPFVGFENSVEVVITDGSGAPPGEAGESLEVEVAFGDRLLRLPLLPGDQPGEFGAVLVPTRPGTYSFHVTGSLDGQRIDVESTCGEASFECVEAASGAQFPVADPSAGELAEGLGREATRVEEASDTAEGAQTIAIAAIVIAAIALGAAGAGLVVRRKSG